MDTLGALLVFSRIKNSDSHTGEKTWIKHEGEKCDRKQECKSTKMYLISDVSLETLQT